MCNPRIVEFIIKRGIPLVKELIRWGCRFDKKGGKYDLAQEGAHSQPRILHAGGDSTGKEIIRVFLNRARALSNINLREHIFAVDLITQGSRCYGILAYDLRAGELFIINSRQTILATGGAGQIYRETTNPAITTGDGLAMAYRAGCLLEGLEFIQFHPTALYIAGATRALVSEAVRGAGGILRNKTGKRFMPDYHPQAELAPRDIVSRSIIHQMNLTNDTNVYLDLTHLAKSYLIKRFPGLYELCRQFNINIARDFIPVRPNAHYLIGGIKVNRRCETNVKHLYAVGEVASSGFHGANRLGSNSLLEGLVLGEMAGITAGQGLPKGFPSFPKITLPRLTKSAFTRRIDITDITNSLKSLMWRDVGVERNGKKLHEVLHQIDYWAGYVMNKGFKKANAWELQNMLTLSYLVTLSAWQRTESRGTHYRVDYPEPNNRQWRKKYITLHV